MDQHFQQEIIICAVNERSLTEQPFQAAFTLVKRPVQIRRDAAGQRRGGDLRHATKNNCLVLGWLWLQSE